MEICAEYNGSNYFHVGKRRFILSEIEFVVKLVENMKKTLDAKREPMIPASKPNEPDKTQ